jgi:hypothetical protein
MSYALALLSELLGHLYIGDEFYQIYLIIASASRLKSLCLWLAHGDSYLSAYPFIVYFDTILGRIIPILNDPSLVPDLRKLSSGWAG